MFSFKIRHEFEYDQRHLSFSYTHSLNRTFGDAKLSMTCHRAKENHGYMNNRGIWRLTRSSFLLFLIFKAVWN